MSFEHQDASKNKVCQETEYISESSGAIGGEFRRVASEESSKHNRKLYRHRQFDDPDNIMPAHNQQFSVCAYPSPASANPSHTLNTPGEAHSCKSGVPYSELPPILPSVTDDAGSSNFCEEDSLKITSPSLSQNVSETNLCAMADDATQTESGSVDSADISKDRLKTSDTAAMTPNSKNRPISFKNESITDSHARPVGVVHPTVRNSSPENRASNLSRTGSRSPTIARTARVPSSGLSSATTLSNNSQSSNNEGEITTVGSARQDISSETFHEASANRSRDSNPILLELSQQLFRLTTGLSAEESIKVEKDFLTRECPYYYGKMTNDQAKQVLRGHVVGSFLLRDSSDPRFLYALSLRTPRGTTSVRIGRCLGCPYESAAEKICSQCTAIRQWEVLEYNNKSSKEASLDLGDCNSEENCTTKSCSRNAMCKSENNSSSNTDHPESILQDVYGSVSLKPSNTQTLVETFKLTTSLYPFQPFSQNESILPSTSESPFDLLKAPMACHPNRSSKLDSSLGTQAQLSDRSRPMVRLDCENEQQTKMPHFPDVIALIDYCKALSANENVSMAKKSRCMFIEKDGRMDTPVLLKEPVCKQVNI